MLKSTLLMLRCGGILLAMVLCANPSLLAGQDRWTPIGPGGGTIQELMLDESGALYAAPISGGLYKSTDGAVSWAWSGRGLEGEGVHVLAAEPTIGGAVYAGTWGGKVFGSVDGGETWAVLYEDDRAHSIDAIAVAPGSSPTIYVAAGCSLLEGHDGVTWASLRKDEDFFVACASSIVPDPLHPGLIYIADSGRVFKNNYQHEWMKLLDEGGALVMAPHHPLILYTGSGWWTHDGGQSWQQVHPGGDNLVVSPVLATTLFTVGERGVYESGNSGEAWSRISQNFPSTGTYGFAVDFNRSPPAMFAGTWSWGVVRSEDGGKSWTTLPQLGLAAGNGAAFLRIDPHQPSTLYADFNNPGLEKSTDGGAHWSPLPVAGRRGFQLWVDTTRADTLYARALGVPGSFRSDDGGETWSDVRLPPSDVRLPASGDLAFLPGNVILAGGCGISRSSNRGRTWVQVLPCHNDVRFPFSISVRHFVLDPLDPRRLYAEVQTIQNDDDDDGSPYVTWGPAEIYRSRDAGLTWHRLARPGGRIAVDPSRRGGLWVSVGDVVLGTSDWGRHWEVRGSAGASIGSLVVAPTQPPTLYAGTQVGSGVAVQGVQRSSDGGRSWTPLNAGLEGNLSITGLTVDPGDPRHLFVSAGELFEIRVSD